jgi:hypothetical protein
LYGMVVTRDRAWLCDLLTTNTIFFLAHLHSETQGNVANAANVQILFICRDIDICFGY